MVIGGMSMSTNWPYRPGWLNKKNNFAISKTLLLLHHEVQSTAYSESATTESYAGYGLGYAVFIWWKGIKPETKKS